MPSCTQRTPRTLRMLKIPCRPFQREMALWLVAEKHTHTVHNSSRLINAVTVAFLTDKHSGASGRETHTQCTTAADEVTLWLWLFLMATQWSQWQRNTHTVHNSSRWINTVTVVVPNGQTQWRQWQRNTHTVHNSSRWINTATVTVPIGQTQQTFSTLLTCLVNVLGLRVVEHVLHVLGFTIHRLQHLKFCTQVFPFLLLPIREPPGCSRETGFGQARQTGRQTNRQAWRQED